MLFSLVHSPVPRLRRIVDIPLKYEGIRPIRIWLRILYCAQLRGNWHCTPMHRFPERQKPTKRRFFCFVMGAHSPLFLAIPCVGIFWRRFENPGSIYGRFLIIFDRSLQTYGKYGLDPSFAPLFLPPSFLSFSSVLILPCFPSVKIDRAGISLI